MIRENLASFDTTNIIVKIGATKYSFWKSASIHIGMGEFCREATFDVSDGNESNAAQILMDSPCTVICDGLTVMTGYIDDVSVNYDSKSHGITIKARSKTCDLVDCSYIGDTQFNQESAHGVINRICAPFGIKVIWKCTDWQIGELNTNVGDTCATIISEICKRGGVFYTDDENGNLIITDLTSTPSQATLFNPPKDTGSNILVGAVHYSSRDRFSEYRVVSQATAQMGDETADNAYTHDGVVHDHGVRRYRPKLVIAETSQDSAADTNTAEQEYMASTAAAADFGYTTNGWKTQYGRIWYAGAFVNVEDGMAHCMTKLVVKSCDLTISETGGRITTFKLAYPNAMIKNYVPRTRVRDPWYYSGKEV